MERNRKSLSLCQNFKPFFINFLKYFVEFLFSLLFIYVEFHISNYLVRKELLKYVWNKKSSCSIYDLIHRRQYHKSHENNVLTRDFQPILQTNTIWIVWIYSQTPNLWDMYLITKALLYCAEAVKWNKEYVISFRICEWVRW